MNPREILLSRWWPVALVVLFITSTSLEAQSLEWGPWSALLPMEHAGGATKVAEAHSPEEDLRDMELDGPGPDRERVHTGKFNLDVLWHALDEEAGVSESPLTEVIQFAERLPEGFDASTSTANAAAYLYRTIRSDASCSRTVMLGSDDGCRLWLNGELAFELEGGRRVEHRRRVLLKLKPGLNHLLVKVVNGGGAWAFSLHPETKFTSDVRQSMQGEINDAIDRGVDYLLKVQQLDGSWGYSAASYRNGQTALSVYALLKSGVSPKHQAIQRALAFLRLKPPVKTYSNAVQILALDAANSEAHEAWIEELAELMLDWQDGDFAYPGGQNDLSCTQYGAFAYRIAAARGVKIPKKAWTDLARSVLRYANDDGGFAYRPREESTGSMTVAGLTTLAVCHQAFGDAGFPRRYRKDLEEAQANGLAWLGRKFSPEQNPSRDPGKQKRWAYYYLYGVERLAALLKLDHFGEHDWYWQGAEFLLGAQGDKGDWATINGESEPNTSFALLFLNRATATSSGPGASRNQGRHYATDSEEARVVLRAKGDTPLNLWLSEIRPDVLATHARTGDNGEGLYLDAVEYLADGQSIARVEADPAHPWSAEPFAIQHAFESPGEHDVQLVLHFAPLGGVALEPVKSPVLTVLVVEKLESWMLDYVDDREANLALAVQKKVTSSSSRGAPQNKDHAGGKAFDGLLSTSWMSADTDPTPELRVEFKKSMRVDQIAFVHAGSSELVWGELDRATSLAIDFGRKGESYTLALDPTSRLKSVLELPKPTKISRLNIRVLEREVGSVSPGIVGFAEIELSLRGGKKR